MLTRKCLFCGKVFPKPPNCSLNNWNNRTEFCSRKCSSDSRKGIIPKGFEKHLFQKGQNTWNKGMTKEKDEFARKLSERMKADNPMKRKEVKEKSSKSHTGYIMPESQRRKSSETHKKRVKAGLNNLYPNWKPNKDIVAKRIYTIDYKIWRSKVFRRDNFTCQNCNARSEKGKAVYLEAHHIKSWARFPKLRFVVDNGQTLCDECHKLTDNYKRKCI